MRSEAIATTQTVIITPKERGCPNILCQPRQCSRLAPSCHTSIAIASHRSILERIQLFATRFFVHRPPRQLSGRFRQSKELITCHNPALCRTRMCMCRSPPLKPATISSAKSEGCMRLGVWSTETPPSMTCTSPIAPFPCTSHCHGERSGGRLATTRASHTRTHVNQKQGRADHCFTRTSTWPFCLTSRNTFSALS